MRAATSKPGHYTKRGLPVPPAVRMRQAQMSGRKLRRRKAAQELADFRRGLEMQADEMMEDGDITEEEYGEYIMAVHAVPLIHQGVHDEPRRESRRKRKAQARRKLCRKARSIGGDMARRHVLRYGGLPG